MNGLIGDTLLIRIKYEYNNKICEVYAKLEYYNLTGSIKDRMAYYIISKNYQNGILKEGMPIVEATSGNTGISFAALGSYYHNPVYIFMPDWVSPERKHIMEMYGAKVILVSKKDGGFKKCIELANELSSKINGFNPHQFSNVDNPLAHYLYTGMEIKSKLDSINGFVSGIGTGGTLMGVGKRLKETNHDLVICAIEPDKALLLSSKTVISNHKIDGIGDDFIPELVNADEINKVITINDDDAINMSRMLSRVLGLGVGISSGANFLGSVLLNDEIGGNIVTVFVDDNKKYISTELSSDLRSDLKFISNKINLISFELV